MRFNGARRAVRALLAITVSTIALVVVPSAASAAPALLPGYQIVFSPLTVIPPGGAASTYAQCPAGISVVSGGMYAEYAQNPSAPVWRSSYPAHLDGADRWGGQVHNTGPQPFGIRAYAVCVNGFGSLGQRKQTVTMVGGQALDLGFGCPEPGVAELGAGFDVETGWGFRVAGVNDYVETYGHFRGPSGVNTSTGYQSWGLYLVCGVPVTAAVQEVRNPASWLPEGVFFVDADCPAGTSVLAGGGGERTTGQTVGSALLGSYPVSATRWRSVLRVDAPGGVYAASWATCGVR